MTQASFEAKREFAFTDREFRFLAKLANDRTGIVLTDNKRDMVYGRLARRLRSLKLDNFGDYCAFLQSDAGGGEIGELVNAITTNLTRFFREEHHFDHLRDQVLGPMVKAGTKRLRIWSAACSSGMEPYSIAMTVKSAIPDLSRWDARILATDIDSNMVAIAEEGEYAASDLKDLPASYKSYVQPSCGPGRVRMQDGLKKLIAFRELNLLESWPMQGLFDAVFCRNVIIYFDKPTKEKLFARMAQLIKSDGWLYIGHSENLTDISDRFEVVGRTVYRKVK